MIKQAVRNQSGTEDLVTCSPRVLELLDITRRFAASSATILITGESGTGKEVLANYVHQHSPFVTGPMVTVNCAALTETLVESELFGHSAGAFTGAVAQRLGCFERAAGGTVFLDEFGELPLPTQAKLLRVLEEGDFQRVGDGKVLKLGARVIVATNRELKSDVVDRRFREDLYHRISSLTLHNPPLRERLEDIPLLINHFLTRFRRDALSQIEGVSDSVINKCQGHNWPGNIRELRNVLLRACLLTDSKVVTELELPGAFPRLAEFDEDEPSTGSTSLSLSDIERRVILKRLESLHGNRTETARTLGITSRTLRNKLAEYRRLGHVG
ncbi:MAG: sigma-54-dependent Fis family transcriptional regulator [Planctomycetaceae bacterium]|nr:sigma-54-dependent Fis family transcriptional regulator [Planctomycetaceae bacterium]